jgi:NADH:ubiquinone reductase (H+-translocating)
LKNLDQRRRKYMVTMARNRKTSVAWKIAGGLAFIGGLYVAYRAAIRLHREAQNATLERGKAIVILGSGFAGLSTARELAHLLPNQRDASIILIDQQDYLLFTPMLTEAAGGGLDTHHIVHPTHHLPVRIRYVQARVNQIDAANRRVSVTIGSPEQNTPEAERMLQADHLVIALGGVNDFRGVPGAQQHALTMKSLLDAALVRNRALAMLSRADVEQNREAQREMLTFVVAGGGYTGVETMAALNGLIREELCHFPRIATANVRTILIHPGDRLLPELSPDLAAYAQSKLERGGVEVRLHDRITAVGENFIESGGERLPTRMLIWAAGAAANPLVKQGTLPLGPLGGIFVDATCAVPGFPNLWALGDCAEVPGTDGKGPYAPTAQNAQHEGVQVARNIVASLLGREPKPFRYVPAGELVLVGKHSGVGSVYGVRFSGLLAWAMWRAVYWAKMPNRAQRLRILTGWMLDFWFGRSAAVLSGTRDRNYAPGTGQAD